MYPVYCRIEAFIVQESRFHVCQHYFHSLHVISIRRRTFFLSLRVSCGQIYSPRHWWLGIEAIPNLSYKQACTCSSDSNLRWTWFMPSFHMPTIIYKTRNVHGSSKERESKRLLNVCYRSYVFINCNSLKCHMYATVMFIIILKCIKKNQLKVKSLIITIVMSVY